MISYCIYYVAVAVNANIGISLLNNYLNIDNY